ncbi:autotransporter outer membrane beta-barrel domain-containing protein [Archangium lansingense]|uniref:autotransporter outer membrane beta-barrel domain-containing protein n=1 Tax=Archangium lansingense TaxID=2995310 RepID=UPI003B805246
MNALAVLVSTILVAQTSMVSVSFDLRSLSAKDYRQLDGLSLERKVSLRLTQEGFAVVSPDHPAAQIRVRARRVENSLVVEALGPAGSLQRVVRLDAGSLDALHFEVTQKVAELSRAMDVPSPETTPPPVTAPAAERGSPLELSLGAGALWRTGAVDPLLLTSARLGLGRIGLDLEAGISASRGLDMHVFETQGSVGLGYRFALAGPLQVEPSAAFGLVLHGYQVTDPFAAASGGTLVGPAGWARLRARWAVAARLSLELRLALGLSTPIDHVSEGMTLWTRGGLRGETVLGLTWAP